MLSYFECLREIKMERKKIRGKVEMKMRGREDERVGDDREDEVER